MIAYLGVTDKNGKYTVRWHQVWDAERFVPSQREMQAKEGATVAVITEEEYRNERWPTAPGKAKS